jgi:hypothetical protein
MGTCKRPEIPVHYERREVVVRVDFPYFCENVRPWLGIEKEVFSVHHKKYIAKVMAHATVGYYFTGDPENDGEGVLIQLQHCQAFKVAQKAYRGKGGIVVKKGDCLLTDCNVTGTDIGTPDKPKFALRLLWAPFII